MKHLFISLLFCSQLFLSQGQNAYLPIFSDSDTTQWVIILMGPGEQSAFPYIVSFDTTITGEVYFRMSCNEINDFEGVCNGFLREDSLDKKVYFYPADPGGALDLSQEKLLYDFDLSPGDSVIVSNWNIISIGELSPVELVLDSISLYEDFPEPFGFDGFTRGTFPTDSSRIFYLTPTDASYRTRYGFETVIWIEGIGSIDGILSPATNFDFTVSIGCIHKSDTTYYQTGIWSYGDLCSLDAVSTENDLESQYSILLGQDRSRESLLLYLDPAPMKDLKLEILDLNGRALYNRIIDSFDTEVEISIRSYPPGAYIFRIYSGTSFFHKIFIK
ncbi:MAG: T9SS type A sorting domain-containing protein [Bacteroidota bacterium]